MSTDGESGCVTIDHECCDSFLCAEEADVKGSALAVCSEGLGSVKDILIAVLDCGCLQSAGIRTCVGLCDREACELAFLDNVCKILDLLRCSCEHNVTESNESSYKGISITGINLCKFFVHHSCRLKAQAHSAVFFRDLSKVKTHLKCGIKQLDRASASAVTLRYMGLDFLLSHILDHCDQFLLLLGIN